MMRPPDSQQFQHQGNCRRLLNSLYPLFDLQKLLNGRNCNVPVDLITNYVAWSLIGTIIWSIPAF